MQFGKKKVPSKPKAAYYQSPPAEKLQVGIGRCCAPLNERTDLFQYFVRAAAAVRRQFYQVGTGGLAFQGEVEGRGGLGDGD